MSGSQTVEQMIEGIDARVRKGMEYLDEFYGCTDWILKVDLSTLDLADPQQCVLGQLFGDFDDAIEEIEGKGKEFDPVLTSFDADEETFATVDDIQVEYAVLTVRWRKALLHRLEVFRSKIPDSEFMERHREVYLATAV